MLLSVLFAFLFAGQVNAATTVVKNNKVQTVSAESHSNFFAKVKDQLKEKTTSGINKIKSFKNAFKTMSLYKAIVLMGVGLIIALVGGAIGGSVGYIISIVGLIFFLIGAIFLLLDLL